MAPSTIMRLCTVYNVSRFNFGRGSGRGVVEWKKRGHCGQGSCRQRKARPRYVHTASTARHIRSHRRRNVHNMNMVSTACLHNGTRQVHFRSAQLNKETIPFQKRLQRRAEQSDTFSSCPHSARQTCVSTKKCCLFGYGSYVSSSMPGLCARLQQSHAEARSLCSHYRR